MFIGAGGSDAEGRCRISVFVPRVVSCWLIPWRPRSCFQLPSFSWPMGRQRGASHRLTFLNRPRVASDGMRVQSCGFGLKVGWRCPFSLWMLIRLWAVCSFATVLWKKDVVCWDREGRCGTRPDPAVCWRRRTEEEGSWPQAERSLDFDLKESAGA